MMNDGRVHDGRMCGDNRRHSHYAWMRIDLGGGGNGGEHEELCGRGRRQSKVSTGCTGHLRLVQYSQL